MSTLHDDTKLAAVARVTEPSEFIVAYVLAMSPSSVIIFSPLALIKKRSNKNETD